MRRSPGRPTSSPRSRWPPASCWPRGPAVRADRERAGGRRAPDARRRSATTSPRCGPASTRWPRATPTPPSPAPARAESSPRPGPRNRPLAYPYNLWHSSQWTVDQASALAALLGRAGRRGRRPGRALALPPRGPALLAGRHAHGSARTCTPGPPWRCWVGPPTRHLGAAAARAATGRGLLLLPGRRAGAAACARPRPRGHADGDRRHGLRRRAVQPLRPAVHGRAGPPAARRAGRARAGHDRVGHALQARPGRLVRPPRRPGPRDRCWPTWPRRRWRPPRCVPVRRRPPEAARRRPPWPRFTVTYGGDGRASSPCARPSWRTWPMGSARPPPAKMQYRPPRHRRGRSSGGRSR